MWDDIIFLNNLILIYLLFYIMKNPYKIIHKFKNDNGRIQYLTYIFIGPLVPEEILKILKGFQDKNFINTLRSIPKKHVKLLENYYGSKWYLLFFNLQHINSNLEQINNSNTVKKEISNKLGKDWYNTHINIKKIPPKKIAFSFSQNYVNYLISRNKTKSLTLKREMDYTTYKENTDQEGGDSEVIDEEKEIEKKLKNEDEEIESEEKTEEELDEEVIEDFNIDELAKLYSSTNDESIKEIKETSKLISKAINDKSWEKKVEKISDNYVGILDKDNFDAIFENSFHKVYITNQYIFPDDNIKTMRHKIAVSLSLNPKFGKDMSLLPEYQYFWTEYTFEKKKDKVMLGQKWIKRNELLKIDIEPNENLKVYENLRNNLSYLRDSFGYKIKREDDESLILRDYDDYITNNEIFMLDTFNELGLNYNISKEKLKNIYDVYINIYFPLIDYQRLETIIGYLNGLNQNELEINKNTYLSLNNDMQMEKEIYTTVEEARGKLEDPKYKKIFYPNYIIQSIIHVNLLDTRNITGTVSDTKLNLYRIFDNFIVNEKYPFIQYMSDDNQITYKYYTKSDVLEDSKQLSKWFESSPYGIRFNLKQKNNRFVSLNLLENGRLEYKITWKEIDEATVDNIIESYGYVRSLIEKINSENKKIKIIPPDDVKFKYAFINTIQKFTLPEKFKINHNDLSEFSRLFFPYISLVIEPKKRESKKNVSDGTISKYGTYLRYKRISNYDNRNKMHLRILYYLRNYELSSKGLIDEVAKQFNITRDNAAKEMDYVKDKYSKVLQKSSKVVKKLKSLPKSKPPGINIDIQGRERDNYKVRITGARNKYQLDEIINFMRVLIFLYSETYLYKKSKYQKLKDQLKQLTKIAKRRNKVLEHVNYDSSIKNVKAITALDKSRLGYRPEEGQNQWTRNCQNSGNKRRRPIIVNEDNISKLLKMGYKLNKKTGFYEKEVDIKERGKKKKVTLKVAQLQGEDGKFNYFACDPNENNEYMYIGFLSRGANPDNLCAPCCFKKDQLQSTNKKKKNYFLKCLGDKKADEKIETLGTKNLGDKIYILQETNKIQEGRFIYLSKYLDYFFNKIWNHDQKIRNHYLVESKKGYYFKYTVKDEKYNYLAAISNIYEISIDDIKYKMINFLQNDKDNIYFTYLNNGDIKESFGTRQKLIDFIKTSNYLEYDIIGELLSLPGVIDKDGFFVFLLEKKTKIIKRNLEKDIYLNRYYLDCLNLENSFMLNNTKYNRNYVILIKENKYYFPVYNVIINPKVSKKAKLTKKYDFNEETFSDISGELTNYFDKSCINTIINKIDQDSLYWNKNIIQLLHRNNVEIKKQIIDKRNKVRFLLIDQLLLPVKPSGAIYDIEIVNIEDYNKYSNLDTTIKKLDEIEKIIKLNYVPKSINYSKKKKDNYIVSNIKLINGLNVPIKNETISKNKLSKYNYQIKEQPIDKIIDEKIKNPKYIEDEINIRVKQNNYSNETYNLFRLELSNHLNSNKKIKEQIIKIVKNDNLKKKQKIDALRKILYQFVSKNKKIKNPDNNDMVVLVKNIPDLSNYQLSNIRDYCKIYRTKDKCNTNLHCLWASNTCKMQIVYNKLVESINKVIGEMIQDGIKFKEIIQENNYFVSDIIDYSQNTTRDNQKIIKSTNFNLKKLMSELFGSAKIPKIGRKKISKKESIDVEEDYPELLELGSKLIQPIIPNNDSIIRSYVNSLYWNLNPLYDLESRNLGYFSKLQTQITYLIKAQIIDYILEKKNNNNLINELKKLFNDDENFFESTLNKFRKTTLNSDGNIELLVLSFLFDIPIVIYDNFNSVFNIYYKGKVKLTDANKEKYNLMKNIIKIQFIFEGSDIIPSKVNAIYEK